MRKDEELGYGQPPKQSRWKPGQSGNPRGRPKTRSEIFDDAARILAAPITAQTSDGRRVRLDGIEAAYLALCKKGLQGHKPSLLEAVRIMLDVGVAAEEAKADQNRAQAKVEELAARLGLSRRDTRDS